MKKRIGYVFAPYSFNLDFQSEQIAELATLCREFEASCSEEWFENGKCGVFQNIPYSCCYILFI